MTTSIAPKGYVRVGLDADIPIEDARRAGALSRHVDVEKIIRLLSEQKAGVISIYLSYSILSAGTGEKTSVSRTNGEEE